MSLTFAKAPLVEIIAELRWIPRQLSEPSRAPEMLIPFIGDTSQETFFVRLSNELHNLGFQTPERLLPPGFVTLLYQPVYRFRRTPDPSPVLYQVGPGIFSAHGLPPYSSWDTFSPDVERGITALLKARGPAEQDASFSRLSLRYIDAFNQELTQGKDEIGFMRDVLGISIQLPASVINVVERGQSPKFGLQITIPAGNGLTMNINLAEGTVKNASAIIMDTTLSRETGVSGTPQEAMNVFNTARQLIHKTFLGLTEPIRELMQPQET